MPTRSASRRLYVPLFLFGLLLAGVAAVSAPLGSGPAGGGRRRGVPAELVLADAAGKGRPFAQVAGKRATVLVFLGTECPVSNKYAPTVAALERQYRAKGVRFVAVYPNAAVTGPEAAKHARAFGLGGLPLALDGQQALADRVGATVTPEAVVLDAHRTVHYVGRIDDRYVARGKAQARVVEKSLQNALDAVLAGGQVRAKPAPAVGCVIERAAKTAKVTYTGPTYARDVAPILQANCQSCHRAGEIGPFPLENFENARAMAANIAAVTGAKRMPPWKPVAGHGDFEGVRRLTDARIKTLRAWADAGAPQGDPKELPPAPRFPQGWTLGKPDLVLTMAEPWKTPAAGEDVYRCFVLPTGLAEDKDVVAVEIRPGNKRVVHHVLVYVDTQGRARTKDEAAPGSGYTSFGGPGFLPNGEMGGWAPGNLPRFLPDGIGRPLPKAADLIVQVHYHPTGKPEEDVTSIGLYFARKPVAKRLRTFPIIGNPLRIPPGEKNYVATGGVPVPFDAKAIAVTPHMHLLGRSMKMTATLPDGATKPLVYVNDWDFNWQETYLYKEPVALPKGTQIKLEATFDNSAENPRNPNSPPKLVKWGEGTADEMCIGFVNYIVDNEDDPTVRLLDGLLGGRRRAAR